MSEHSTFKEWFDASLGKGGYAPDIASHGADSGFPHITYTSDCVALFDEFADDIWNMAVEEADQMGCKNVAEMIAGFRRDDMMSSIDQFKNLMVWFACEQLARDYEPSDDGSDSDEETAEAE